MGLCKWVTRVFFHPFFLVEFQPYSGWWFQPIPKILVKLDHFPSFRGENKKYLKPPPIDIVYKAKYTIHQDTETHGFRRPKPLNEKYLKPPASTYNW